MSWISFSPDGSQMLTTIFGGNAYLWDVLTGERMFALAIDGELMVMAFIPDAQQIMSVSLKAAIRFFPVDPLGTAISRKHRSRVGQGKKY